MDEVLYYRIKAIEPGTAGFYSKIITIKTSSSSDNLIVSPNPVSDHLYLRVPGNNFLNKEIMLVNMSGIVVRSEKINEATSQLQLNVSMLPRGAYVIKIIDPATGRNYKTVFTK